MKDWYLVRENLDNRIIHRGQVISPSKKIFLSDFQFELHAKNGDVLVKTDPPSSIQESAISVDFKEWRKQKVVANRETVAVGGFPDLSKLSNPKGGSRIPPVKKKETTE